MDNSAIPPVLCILGHPIAGNPMQFSLERALAAAGLDWRFLSLDVAPERLAAALAGLDALGFVGAALAPPLEAAAAALAERRSDEATAAQWIDCLARDANGELVGHNLIAQVFREAVQLDREEKSRAVLLGDDPLIRAAVAPLLGEEIRRLTLVDAPADVWTELRDRGGPSQPASWTLHADATAAKAINAKTGLVVRGCRPGSRGRSGAAAVDEPLLDELPPQAVIVDLAIHSGTSPLVRAAQERGRRAIAGIDLLVARAAAAFALWTGRSADLPVLREAFEEYLEI